MSPPATSPPAVSLAAADRVLALAVVALLVLALLAFALLVLERALSALAARRARRREAALTPLVHRALADRAAARDLARALGRGDRPVLRTMLLKLALDLRGEETRTIGLLYRGLGLLDAELARLRRGSRRRRIEAAANLGTLRSPTALPALVRALDDRDTGVRTAAVRAVGEVGGAKALTALVGMLGDPSRAVARRAEEILAEKGREIAGEIVAYLRETDQPAGRQAAVELLGWLRAPEAAPPLLALVGDPNDELRIRAVKAAAAIGDPRFLEPFHALLADPRWEVRCQAAKGLGLLGSPESIPRLRAALADPVWWVRYHAAAALAELGPAGVAALEDALTDARPAAREMARHSLARQSAAAARP